MLGDVNENLKCKNKLNQYAKAQSNISNEQLICYHKNDGRKTRQIQYLLRVSKNQLANQGSYGFDEIAFDSVN